MRILAAGLLTVCAAWGQFKSTVPLVVAPTTVTDAKGHFVDGLDAHDLILYDNNVRVPAQLDFEVYPISLVVAVQASSNSEAVLDKLGRSGNLFAEMLAGEGGETAVISFADEVRLHQDFTSNADELTQALQGLKVEGEHAVTLDGVNEALRMLGERAPNRRRIVLLVAERRVRTSTVDLKSVVLAAERQNALIYWLTYSPLLTPFTAKPQKQNCDKWGKNCELAPSHAKVADPLTSLILATMEVYHLTKPDVSELFTKATGAKTMNFLKRSGLEEAIQAVAAEVHRQYILTYQPLTGAAGVFHPLRVEVKGRPELQVRTRAGYWTVQ
ncbi:MAG TPA: VWA domain-containing protein [Bryobacteraceae bacterium]|nr:VWA domain-containing protein [Bryobacteraceae bacterium]